MSRNWEEDSVCNLSPEVREIAKRELREDDVTRKVMIGNFRDWIKKQTYICNCRTDDRFLLRFLRCKKFSLPVAQEALLTYLTTRKVFPNWYMNLNPTSTANLGLAEYGHIFPLLERDAHGRKVIFKRAEAALKANFSIDDAVKSLGTCAEILFDNEEDQVRGFVVIADYQGIGLQILAFFTPAMHKQFIKSSMKLAQVRVKQVHLINVHPSIVNLAQLALSFCSEKLQKRIFFHKDLGSLHRCVPKEILPQEFGGKVSQKVMTDAWKRQLEENKDYIRRVNEIDVDDGWTRPKEETQSIMGCEGSFRSLQID